MNKILREYTSRCQEAFVIVSPPMYLGITANTANTHEKRFQQEYLNNPSAFRQKAMQQWQRVVDRYHQVLNGRVVEIPNTYDPYISTNPAIETTGQQHLQQRYFRSIYGSMDQSFSADPVMCLNDKRGQKNSLLLLRSHFTNANRSREPMDFLTQPWNTYYPDHDIYTLPMNNPFEGTGDCVFDYHRNVFFAGYTANPDPNDPSKGRSNKAAHAELTHKTNLPVIGLELCNDFYHVDTCLMPLPTGHFLICQDGLSEASYNKLVAEALTPYGYSEDEYFINVSKYDAETHLLTNVTCIDNKIFMPFFDEDSATPANQNVIKRLNAIGYDVELMPYSQFIKVGGAIHCSGQLVVPIHDHGLVKLNP